VGARQLWDAATGAARGMLHTSKLDWQFPQDVTARAVLQAKKLAKGVMDNISKAQSVRGWFLLLCEGFGGFERRN